MTEKLNAPAPAKVNLVLEVCGRREDGYHDIATLIQTLELADTVTLRFGTTPGVTVSGPYAEGTPADETNLAWRAAVELAKLTGKDVGRLAIHLEKRVPPAGGLGGGSSDAATVLRLLQRAWPKTEQWMLAKVAQETGSDVVAIADGGTVLAFGRGELSFPSDHELPEHGVVLFVPPVTVNLKTARMFAALGKLPFDEGSLAEALDRRMPCQIRGADVFNAFERVAFDVFPGLAGLWEDLETRIGEPIHLAGAGPTLFWIGPPGEARGVAARARGLPCKVIETRTSPSLWRP